MRRMRDKAREKRDIDAVERQPRQIEARREVFEGAIAIGIEADVDGRSETRNIIRREKTVAENELDHRVDGIGRED
jgi:hypothetical protein